MCLYGLGNHDRVLYRIDAEGSTAVGAISPVASNADLALLEDAGDGLVYTIDRRANTLHTLRLSDARVVSTVRLDVDVRVTRRGLARAPDGTLYGVLPGMQLRTIDPATGATMLIGPITGAEMVEALAFTPDGELFALGSAETKFASTLYRIDTNSAAATFVADLPVPDADTLTFAGGFLYAADSTGNKADLWRIDPATGALTTANRTGIDHLNGLTSATCRD